MADKIHEDISSLILSLVDKIPDQCNKQKFSSRKKYEKMASMKKQKKSSRRKFLRSSRRKYISANVNKSTLPLKPESKEIHGECSNDMNGAPKIYCIQPKKSDTTIYKYDQEMEFLLRLPPLYNVISKPSTARLSGRSIPDSPFLEAYKRIWMDGKSPNPSTQDCNYTAKDENRKTNLEDPSKVEPILNPETLFSWIFPKVELSTTLDSTQQEPDVTGQSNFYFRF